MTGPIFGVFAHAMKEETVGSEIQFTSFAIESNTTVVE